MIDDVQNDSALPNDQGVAEPDNPDVAGSPPDEGQLDENVYDPADGIPYRNKVAEARRKEEEAQKKAESYEKLLQTMANKPQTQQKEPQGDPFEEFNSVQSPAELMRKASVYFAKQNADRERANSLRRVYRNPDMNNPNSELYQKVNAEYQWLGTMGISIDNNPTILEDLVIKVSRDLNGTKAQATPAYRGGPQPISNIPMTQRRAPAQKQEEKIPDELQEAFRGIDSMLGVTKEEKDALKATALRRMREERDGR